MADWFPRADKRIKHPNDWDLNPGQPLSAQYTQISEIINGAKLPLELISLENIVEKSAHFQRSRKKSIYPKSAGREIRRPRF